MSLTPNTPVLAGVGVATQRFDDPSAGVEASELMVQAALNAADDAGSRALLDKTSFIAAMGSMSQYNDPARLVGDALGLGNVATLRADPGRLQQAVFNKAANLVADGADVVLVVSGEAKWRDLRGAITGAGAPVTRQGDDVEPGETWRPSRDIIHQVEIDAQLFQAVDLYAMLERALAQHDGKTMAEQMQGVAELWSRMSRHAVDNPDAWNREFFPAERIATVDQGNRMVAWPYTKWHNSQWNVDQAACLLFCSNEVADSAGVSNDKRLFLRGGAESRFAQSVVLRPDLHRAPWIAATAEAALDAAGATVDEIDHVELYSCFPVAVQVQAREIGLSLDRDLSISGGMTFAGGPLNSWVLHATHKMAELLREDPGSLGMVTSISGHITKHGVGLWSTDPGNGWAGTRDVTDAVAAAAEPMVVDADYEGPATLVSSTVQVSKSGEQRGVVMADTPAGSRVLGTGTDPDLVAELTRYDTVPAPMPVVFGPGRAVSLA